MSSTPSSQTNRGDRCTEDPDRRQLQRVDVAVSNHHWSMFDAIRDCGHSKRDAVELALETLFFVKIIQGEVSRSVQAEIILPNLEGKDSETQNP